MASRAENRVVNLAGLVQGITVVTFPAASSIFTGRILFAAIVRWMPARIVPPRVADRAGWHLHPDRGPPDDTPWLSIAVFGLAGLGCSAVLPLTISLGQHSLTTMSAAVAGGVIALYQVGYGVAAFGVGPLVDRGVSLSSLYGWTAVAAAAMAVLSFAAATRQASPRELHPRPAGHRQSADSAG